LTIGKQSGKSIVKYKIKEVTGEIPTKEEIETITKKVKEKYAKGRKASLREEEFKKILREVGLNNSH